jgi:ABC-2 type transport system ATP-binding protein
MSSHAAALIPVVLVAVGFAIFCLVDVARAEEVRYLPRWAWAVISLISVPLGGIVYLIFGRRRQWPADEPASRSWARHPGSRARLRSLSAARPRARGLQAGDHVIEVDRLCKRFGRLTAVDDLSFAVRPGRVTGFLGPNGAGKTTTLRIVLGLHAPTSGAASVAGWRYHDLTRPLYHVGALLDADGVHPDRTASSHLLAVAQSNGIGRHRVAELLQLTGLQAVADERLRGFSQGMRQRLGIALALLGDAPILIFDEPVNGLDPEGIQWIRGLFKTLAAEGRTVLVSSHLMSEMAQTADHLIIIGRGRLLADAPIDEFIAAHTRSDVRVRSARADELATLLTEHGAHVTRDSDDDALTVTGIDPAGIGELAAARGLALHELVARHASLEQAYLAITRDSVDYHAGAPLPAEHPQR